MKEYIGAIRKNTNWQDSSSPFSHGWHLDGLGGFPFGFIVPVYKSTVQIIIL